MSDARWGLWLRQVMAVTGIELRRRFVGRRAFGLYLICALPVIPLLLRLLFHRLGENETVAQTTTIFSMMFQTVILRVVLFLGTVSIFVYLFRGDELERVLHLYFLSPIRREVLVAGKYVAGVVLCAIPFSLSVIASFVAIYLPHGVGAITEHAGELAGYVGVTWLGVAGYGGIALLLGLLFKNAMLPALALWGWEFLNPVLPVVLKKISILHYLLSLMPVHPPDGPLAVIAEPSPIWIALPSVMVLVTALLALAAWRVRGHEVRYSAE